MCIVCIPFLYGVLNIKGIKLYENIKANSQWAWLFVENFFIISGFFLFLKTDFTQNFKVFAVKKYLRFIPVIIFVLLLCLLRSFFTNLEFKKYENIFTILNIQNIGLTFAPGNIQASWFVSVLFWCSCFYFYLYKTINNKIFNLITACLVFICYAVFVHVIFITHIVMPWDMFANVINYGMIRGFAGIGVGYFIAMLYKDYINKIKQFVFNVKQKLIVTVVEIYLFSFIIYYSVFHKISFDNFLIMVIPFVGLFILFIIQKGYLSRFLNNDFSVFCGKFTFSIFLTHEFIRDTWAYLVCQKHTEWVVAHPIINIILIFAIIILFGMFTYYFVEKPSFRYLKNKFGL